MFVQYTDTLITRPICKPLLAIIYTRLGQRSNSYRKWGEQNFKKGFIRVRVEEIVRRFVFSYSLTRVKTSPYLDITKTNVCFWYKRDMNLGGTLSVNVIITIPWTSVCYFIPNTPNKRW